jgi:hypothetical protein
VPVTMNRLRGAMKKSDFGNHPSHELIDSSIANVGVEQMCASERYTSEAGRYFVLFNSFSHSFANDLAASTVSLPALKQSFQVDGLLSYSGFANALPP